MPPKKSMFYDTDDEKLEWINLVKEEEERTGNSLHRLQKHIKEEEKTLQGYLEDVEIMLTGTGRYILVYIVITT